MRSSLASLAILGLVLSACPDEVGEDETTSTTDSPPNTTTGETTDGDTVVSETDTGSTSGSSTGETESVDDSTGPVFACGNGMVEGDEICDGPDVGAETCMTQGFDEGELGCLPDCTGYDTSECLTAVCGDGMSVGSELCDGMDTEDATCLTEGFDSGTLACMKDCASYDTSGCGNCGNNQVDGAEACDDVWLEGQTCLTQGFDSGDIACALDCNSFDTAGCGVCGNEVVDGAEVCDGTDLGIVTSCTMFGFAGGALACQPSCGAYDVWGCGVEQFDVSAATVSQGGINRFRGNGYTAQVDGVLVDFGVYLGLAAPCDLDFYVYEATMFGGPYTQVARTTVDAEAGTDYYRAGIPLVPVTAGRYYVLGVGWGCMVTSYYNSSGAYAGDDGGIGLFNVSHFDNAYPGPSDMYVPPMSGTPNTAYAQQVFFGL